MLNDIHALYIQKIVRPCIALFTNSFSERRFLLRVMYNLMMVQEIESFAIRKRESANIRKIAAALSYRNGGRRLWLFAWLISVAVEAPLVFVGLLSSFFLVPVYAAYEMAQLIVYLLKIWQGAS